MQSDDAIVPPETPKFTENYKVDNVEKSAEKLVESDPADVDEIINNEVEDEHEEEIIL